MPSLRFSICSYIQKVGLEKGKWRHSDQKHPAVSLEYGEWMTFILSEGHFYPPADLYMSFRQKEGQLLEAGQCVQFMYYIVHKYCII